MRFAFLTAVAFVVSISAVARVSRGDDVAKGEFEKLGGTWEVVDENVNGQSRSVAGLRNAAKVMILSHTRSMIVLNKHDSLTTRPSCATSNRPPRPLPSI